MATMKKAAVLGRARKLALVLACGMAFVAQGRDLIWVGGAEGADAKKWDLTTLNWRVAGDETRTPVAFESGDNVLFDDSAVSFDVYMMQVAEPNNQLQYNIGNVVFSNDVNNYSWQVFTDTWTQARGAMGTVDKWGDADLTIKSRFDNPGDFTCHGGRVISATGSWWVGEWRSTLGSLHNTRSVTFLPGTALKVTANALFGAPGSASSVSILFNGAAIDLQGQQAFPIVTFTNCPSFFAKGGNLCFWRNAYFRGHGLAPHVLAGDNYLLAFNRAIDLGNSMSSTIHVDDLTGDGVTVDGQDDLIVSNKLGCVVAPSNGSYPCETSFRKTGKGTMVLANSKYSDATGDVEVAEGKLVICGQAQGLGLTASNWLHTAIGAVAGTRTRTVTVRKDGTLEILKRNTESPFGCLNTPQEWNLLIDGGTLVLGEETLANFGCLTLKDATFQYTKGPSSGWFPSWGAFTIAQKLAFDGSTPYDLTVPAHTGLRDIPYLTLGFTLSSEKGDEPVKPAWPHLTNLWSVVDFDVTDITKDSETDATIRLPIRNMVNMSYPDYNNTKINGYTYNPWQWCYFQGGIRKTGAGTLCLNGAISYTHTTEVAGGALLVDSSLATSSGVTIDSGAWLGGTGTVSTVTVKDGGGFICYAGRNTAKPLRVPSLTAEGDVVVRVANPDGREATDFRQPVLQLTAKPASVDFQNWRVSYDGEEDHGRSFSFRYDPGTGVVSAFYSGGTMVIFR